MTITKKMLKDVGCWFISGAFAVDLKNDVIAFKGNGDGDWIWAPEAGHKPKLRVKAPSVKETTP